MPVALHHPSVTSHRCASYIDRSLSGLFKRSRRGMPCVCRVRRQSALHATRHTQGMPLRVHADYFWIAVGFSWLVCISSTKPVILRYLHKVLLLQYLRDRWSLHSEDGDSF